MTSAFPNQRIPIKQIEETDRYNATMPFSFFRNLFGFGNKPKKGNAVTVTTSYYLSTQLASVSPPELAKRYRKQFRTNLIGTWYAANGTMNAVMNERFIFYPDHTGRKDDFGPFGGLRDSTLFEWQEVADHTIRLRVTRHSWESEEDEEPEDEEEQWEEVRYDFGIKPTSFGDEVILQELFSDDRIREEGFWISLFDLGYSGPPIDPNEE